MQKTNKAIVVVLLVAILVLLNINASLSPGQLDLTAEKVYTLSPGSHEMLDKIEETVVLKYYFSRSEEGLPINFKNYATRVESLLEQYANAARGKLKVEKIDPEPYSDTEEQAIRAGIQQLPLPNGGNLFFGLQAIVADQEQAIPVFDPRREEYLEYDISRLIYEVQLFEKPTLGLITSLDMVDSSVDGSLSSLQSSDDWYFIRELRRNFNLLEIEGSEIPGEVDVLAVIHPNRLSEGELFMIDQFVLSGRPALFAVDPSSYTMRAQSGRQASPLSGATSSDLERLFRAWHIEYDSRKVLGDPERGALVRGSDGRPVRHPLIIEYRDFNADEPVAGELEQLLFVEPGAISLKPGSRNTFVPLVSAGEQAGLMEASAVPYTRPDSLAVQLNPWPDPMHIAARVSGKFLTAFPDGKPIKGGDNMDDLIRDLEEEKNPSLKESSTTSNIFVVADTDFLSDEMATEQVNFLGKRSMVLRNDNIALGSNMLEFLAGSKDLISIRGKSAGQRPFEVVDAMRVAAEQKFRDQLSELELRQSKIQNEIRSLRNEQSGSNALIVSQEVQDALEAYALEEQQIGREIRDIQRTLNQDIDALEFRLAAINILFVPSLLLIFGVGYFVNRTRNQRD